MSPQKWRIIDPGLSEIRFQCVLFIKIIDVLNRFFRRFSYFKQFHITGIDVMCLEDGPGYPVDEPIPVILTDQDNREPRLFLRLDEGDCFR